MRVEKCGSGRKERFGLFLVNLPTIFIRVLLIVCLSTGREELQHSAVLRAHHHG